MSYRLTVQPMFFQPFGGEHGENLAEQQYGFVVYDDDGFKSYSREFGSREEVIEALKPENLRHTLEMEIPDINLPDNPDQIEVG